MEGSDLPAWDQPVDPLVLGCFETLVPDALRLGNVVQLPSFVWESLRLQEPIKMSSEVPLSSSLGKGGGKFQEKRRFLTSVFTCSASNVHKGSFSVETTGDARHVPFRCGFFQSMAAFAYESRGGF